ASVAALALVGGAAVWPMLAGAREQARTLACQTNMATAGLAFSSYAGENRDSLPMASASLAGSRWWEVGSSRERSNSANLFTLVRTGHASLADLACHGNACACTCPTKAGDFDWKSIKDVSYSYQNLYSRFRPRWTEGARSVVMIDRSPVILRAIRGEAINPVENSPNHRGRGQNALLGDGSTLFLNTPVLPDGDNVWLPRGLEGVISRLSEPVRAQPLRGTEAPAAPGDAFLVP
ncbi:MAG TPA: hypothetical protein VD963_06410, partial [Phycisphaerales bacterium]|nr:hypothetical protein [Phycisphaerales bacterium]